MFFISLGVAKVGKKKLSWLGDARNRPVPSKLFSQFFLQFLNPLFRRFVLNLILEFRLFLKQLLLGILVSNLPLSTQPSSPCRRSQNEKNPKT
jgi:hypothetical protein